MNKIIMYAVPDQEAGTTVERFLRRRGLSHALLTRLKATPDGLTLDGAPVFTNANLPAGSVLRLDIREDAPSQTVQPAAAPLCFAFHDDDLSIVNKPAGMAVHPSQGNRETSLANAMAALYLTWQKPFVFRAIGRLDKNTSGLTLLANNPLSACLLSRSACRGLVKRDYLAICTGRPPATGVIDAPIGRMDGSVLRREVRTDGERAITHFERLLTHKHFSLVHLWLDTGRTHQIRVHMAHIGHPLIGDFLYHPDSTELSRHALHAARLSLPHPLTGQELSFDAPLPDDMAALLFS